MGTRRDGRPDAASGGVRPGHGRLGILFTGVLISLGLVGFGRFAGPLVIAVQGATLVYGLWTLGSRSQVTAAAALVIAGLTIALVATDATAGGHPGPVAQALTAALGFVLAAGSFGRMAAASEAIIGQLYRRTPRTRVERDRPIVAALRRRYAPRRP